MTTGNEKPNIRLISREHRSVTFKFEGAKVKLYSLAQLALECRATLILDENSITFAFQTEEIAKEIVKAWNLEN